MLGNIENVNIISSFHKLSKPYGKIENRKTHGFLFKIEGYSVFTIGEKRIKIESGDMIFMPKGVSYDYVTDGGEYTSINFEADIENPEIAIYSLKDYQSAFYMLKGFSESWNFSSTADRYKCLSDFYDLLSYISHIDEQGKRSDAKYRLIEPAIEFLKKHIYDADLRIDRLHRLCGISDTYFRKIFLKRFALTPQEYVLKERITHARLIIESGDYDSIKSVAESVGFSDPLYFSKAFRKYYGFPPSSI